MRSSLGSRTTQSVSHLRNQTTADGWAGEAVETIVTIDDNIPCRIEWAEGEAPAWDVWVFESGHEFLENDILIAESLGTALMVKRSSDWSDLQGLFHHYEVTTVEHPLTIAELTGG